MSNAGSQEKFSDANITPLSIHFDSISCKRKRLIKFTKQKKWEKNIQSIVPIPLAYLHFLAENICNISKQLGPGAVARSEASSLGMQAAQSSIPTSGTFFRGNLVMKTFLGPFSLFRWFKKSSCQLLEKECALSTGKLPRRLAQEQCG